MWHQNVLYRAHCRAGEGWFYVTSFADMCPEEECAGAPVGYHKRGGILMRKRQPCWKMPSQLCLKQWPQSHCSEILRLAHASHIAGHLEVNKTYDRVLQNFYLPGLKLDVRNFSKTCQVCQFTSKPNQKVLVAPLQSIPASDEPFSRVLVDPVWDPYPKQRLVISSF